MKTKRLWQIGLAFLASPLMGFWVFYVYRWCLTGRWVAGGGERAMLAFLLSVLILAPAVIIEIEA